VAKTLNLDPGGGLISCFSSKYSCNSKVPNEYIVGMDGNTCIGNKQATLT